ncbi:PREDICTED: uncharacterized protein LOC104586857 [Nelumbo nucifera]|uniref:Uncharacterized protein LOC104586857 n=2 Tax=Nelumbo nucifera TaxID=4432 RepID=A0A1U7Z6L4_NELNU|nr:PREDICTED: uncharacterized protein LOC104586857 [Nelumbo nucifera]XP_010242528.1 PREDICTED: uncharacterized protein LOC104586857 [Nelumbo nucifera]DAD37838.1 TPA_asm: hypothetical protein HUJ06_008479 [Nelumbo nucifera]
MGQVFGTIQEGIQGKEWRKKQLKKISDRVFDRFKNESGKANLTFEDLYIAILLVYNDINKHLAGPHIDPPSKVDIRTMMMTYDLNLDGELDREEFAGFIQKLTKDTVNVINQNLIIAFLVAPAVALMTKRATEGVPGVGRVVQRVPTSVYASAVTLAVVLLQRSGQEIE